MSALYGFSGPPRREWLDAMGHVLQHRGHGKLQYDEGLKSSIGYVHSRNCDALGIAPGGMYRDGDTVIVAAGYFTQLPGGNCVPLKRLLDHFLQRGLKALREVRGDFVLVICAGNVLHLVRDASGVRSLYYAWRDGRLFFSVEPKGILAIPGFPRRLCSASLAQYLAFSYVPGPRTMLNDVHILPAGHAAHFHGDGPPLVERYFHFEEDEACEQSCDAEIVGKFQNSFSQVVADRLPSSAPVGVFLSGGLDSSLVTAETAYQAPGRVHTYSLHFGHHYPNELSFASEVADRCGTRHEEVLLRPRDFLPRLREMIWQLDDPIGDPITMPNYELSRRVSQQQSLVFNGEGGDPCFGGPKNLPMLLQHWYGGIDRDEHFRERAYLASYRRAYEEITRLLTPEFVAEIDYERDLVGVLSPFFRANRPRHFLNKLMSINIRLKGAQLILPKVERMTGASGLTPLAPLFSEEMVRLSMRLPPRMKLQRGVEKVILKRAFADALPASVIQRPKSGMRVPVHFWFQGELKRYARKVLSQRALRQAGIFQPQRVKQLLDYNTEEGPGRYGLRLWMLLTFEIWRRLVIEREAV